MSERIDHQIEITMTLERMEALVKKMDKQIGELGEATGMMLWDLHYALTEMSPDDLFDVVSVWLETGFAKAVMEATELDHEKWLRLRGR